MKGFLVILLAASLHLPKDKVGTPVLAGSRIVEVNCDGGKVFGSGQRNLVPLLMRFDKGRPGTLNLRPAGYRSPEGMQWRGRGARQRRKGPTPFPILE